jgi:hypothetical protein
MLQVTGKTIVQAARRRVRAEMGKGKKLVESIQYAEGGCRPDGPEKPSSHRESLTRPRNISEPEFGRCRRLLPICRPAGPEKSSSHREPLTKPKDISETEFGGCRRLLPICRPDGPENPSSHREPLTRPKNISNPEFEGAVACYRYAGPMGLKPKQPSRVVNKAQEYQQA